MVVSLQLFNRLHIFSINDYHRYRTATEISILLNLTLIYVISILSTANLGYPRILRPAVRLDHKIFIVLHRAYLRTIIYLHTHTHISIRCSAYSWEFLKIKKIFWLEDEVVITCVPTLLQLGAIVRTRTHEYHGTRKTKNGKHNKSHFGGLRLEFWMISLCFALWPGDNVVNKIAFSWEILALLLRAV